MVRRTEIIDFQNPALDVYARLHESQLLHLYEPAPGLCIVESPNVIERAMQSGLVAESFLLPSEMAEKCGLTEDRQPPQTMQATETKEAEHVRALLDGCSDVPVYTAPFEVLKQLTGFALTRGLLCAMRRNTLLSVEEICGNTTRLAVLEHVVNPTNVGAVFRSAAALHMDAVLLTPDCSDPYYRRAARVSMGTVFQIPWTYFPKKTIWPGQGMQKLKELGFKTVAMALRNNTVDIDDPALKQEEKLAVFLGAEGDGLMTETIDACDYTVKIPMSHGVDSLNVAAASAVAFWELGRRR